MDFNETTELVIDTLEGGYYHPDMLKDGRVKDSRYANSGETMFGIDRKAGGSINTTTAGKRFWNIIDNANARSNWKWNYKGGKHENKLKELVGEMIRPRYESLANKYMSPETKKIVDKDDKLRFHFIYATWNGSGWFRKFAKDINEAVDRGVKNRDELHEIAINSRTKEGLSAGSSPNSLIYQTGKKIEGLFEEYADKFSRYGILGIAKSFAYSPLSFIKRNKLAVAGSVMLLTTGVLTIYYFKSKK